MGTPLLLALTAGMLSAVNPCGFAMLPAYLSVLVAGGADRPTGGRAGAVWRALACTAALTAGYVAVFGAVGLAFAPAAGWIQPRLPWLTAGLGLLFVVLGGWLLAGRHLPVPGFGFRAPRLRRSLPSMVLFGMAYAVASLTCTIAPFLAIVVSSLRAGSLAEGVALFVAYAAGMGLVVGVTALAVSVLQDSLVGKLRRAGALAPRLSGLVLVAAGGYVCYYGWYELRIAADLRVAAAGDPVIGAATGLQQRIAGVVDGLGPAVLAALLAMLVLLGWVAGRLRRATVPGD
nr:cytochrome c biogenesis CcdA family protein [Micromonospora sp. DSM 115978]